MPAGTRAGAHSTAAPTKTNPVKSGMEIGVWVALGYFTQAIGLETSDASVYCAFLCSLSVQYMEKFPGKSLQLSIEQLISVAALTGIWCIFSAGGHLAGFSFVKDPQILAALSYTGLVTTSLAIWLETVCLEKVPATEMSVIFSTEPLWATLVSALLLKETMGPNALVGADVILLACLVARSEKISELVGMGEGKGNDTLMDTEVTDAEEGAEEPFQLQETEEVNDDDFPSSVLDEMVGVTEESDSESSFRMSMVQESTVPGGVYGGDPAFAGEEGTLRNNDNDVPAATPVRWFGSYGKHKEVT